jgi:hypothetical protein
MTTFNPLSPKKPELKFAATASIITNPNKSVLHAIQSWRAISKSVFLFNSPNDLNGEVPNVTYTTPDTFPCSLQEVMHKLAQATYGEGAGVLVAEDVFIQPEALQAITVSAQRSLGNAWAATARAKEYSPVAYAKTETLTQTGLMPGYSCFITTHSAWKTMAKDCPKSIRAGSQEGFEWVAHFLSSHIQANKYHDIEGLSPFWQPGKRKEPGRVESTKPIKGPQKRYV